MTAMYNVMRDAKRNYILAMNAAFAQQRDDGTSMSHYEIRRRLSSCKKRS